MPRGDANNPSFPDGFLWGAASSAYQVEGAADADGRAPSVWDRFAETPGKTHNGETGAIACDSYHRYQEDAKLVSELGCDAYRLSISWPRVLPNGVGKANEAGVDYYNRVIDALLERNVNPWITLYHWDLPIALQDRGGWRSRDCVGWFEQYAVLLAERFGDRVEHWFTLNEPQVFIGHGYLSGVHAPGEILTRAQALQLSHHALLAHGKACQAIRSASPGKTAIGWAPATTPGLPATDSDEDIEAARRHTFRVASDPAEWYAQTAWYSDPAILGAYPDEGERVFGADMPTIQSGDMELIKQPLDFYGVNIYSGHRVRAGADGSPTPLHPIPGAPATNFGWSVEPECLYWGPRFLTERYRLPVYVTESGLASMDWVHADGHVHDAGRIDYLARHLHQLRRAVRENIDVRGYFHWSIMDNYEWAEGFAKRFGLVFVDFQTLERLPKDSYHWYRQVIETNGRTIPQDQAPIR